MKLRIVELLLVTTVPTMIVAEGGLPSLWLIFATVFGGTLAAGGAHAFNMYIDRDIDALMERTKDRPLVTGEVTPRQALAFAFGIESVAFLRLWGTVNLLSACLAVSATLFYVFVYSLWLKRNSTANIVIGGAAGAVPVLVGWSAVTNTLDWPPVVLFAIIFYWTPPHFWALAIRYRDDYQAADVPMLPDALAMYERGVSTGVNGANRGMIEHHAHFSDEVSVAQRELFVDPQTSGGLLVAVPEAESVDALKALHERGVEGARRVGVVEARSDDLYLHFD